MATAIPTDKPAVELSGHDGNAVMVLARCMRAAKKAGWTEEQVMAWKDKATSGDYDNVLAMATEHFEVS